MPVYGESWRAERTPLAAEESTVDGFWLLLLATAAAAEKKGGGGGEGGGGGGWRRGGGGGVESRKTIVRFTKSVYKRTTRPPFVNQPKGMAMPGPPVTF